MSNEIYDKGLRNQIRAVEQAIAMASVAKDSATWGDSIERVFKEIVKLWIYGGEISNVGFVLARVLDAMRELEQGGDAICV